MYKFHIVLYPDSMEQSPHSEANISVSNQEIPNILWNSKFHYRVYSIPPFVRISSQMNPVHATQFHSLRSILMLYTHLPFGRYFRFPTKTYTRFFSPYACHRYLLSNHKLESCLKYICKFSTDILRQFIS